MKSLKMNRMQRDAYKKLERATYRISNAPTGSWKSLLICFLAARELSKDPERKVVIAVPQTIIGKGFQPI